MENIYLGLRTLIHKVKDLKAATVWYSQILGVAPYFDEPFYVGFNVGGYELGLQPVEEGESPVSVTYWGVENVEKTYTELLESGAKPYEIPTDVGSGIVVATVIDPFGHLLGIIYNPHFSLS